MDIKEKFCIYKAEKFKPILNEPHPTYSNILFGLAIEKGKEMRRNRYVGYTES
jgi:hypothetical protein